MKIENGKPASGVYGVRHKPDQPGQPRKGLGVPLGVRKSSNLQTKATLAKFHMRVSEVPSPRGRAGSEAPEVEGAAFWGEEVVDLAEIYRSVGFA